MNTTDSSADNQHANQRPTLVRPTPISGFPEYPPGIQLSLERTLDDLRHLFRAHGFVPIDTPIVERLEVLAAKGGDVDKEMYVLERISAGDDSDTRLGLRYDLTVPLARYVAAHLDKLVFPFKRFHIGDCWRGERPQDGRYRQFKQADLDIVSASSLPLSFDADIPLLMNEALRIMGVDDYVFRISNRKILSGYLTGLGCRDQQEITRILDKLDKAGLETVTRDLVDSAKLPVSLAERVVRIASISTADISFVDEIKALGVSHPLLDEGISELGYVMKRVGRESTEFRVDLSITRGFDYYTGSVYEVRWNQHPGIGSIAAGGRYDDLAQNFTRQRLPGVGMSLGVSRILGKQVQIGTRTGERITYTHVLIAWDQDDDELTLQDLASQMRRRGLNVEVFHEPSKLGKQVMYAHKKRIPFVVFPRFAEYKRMENGEQMPFNAENFIATALTADR